LRFKTCIWNIIQNCEFYVNKNKNNNPGALPAACLLDSGALWPGVKRRICETDHSPLPSVEVKIEDGYTSTPPYVFRELTEAYLPSPEYEILR